MLITDIIDIDKRKSKIYIDNELFCSLYKGEIRRLGLELDMELSDEILTEMYSVLYKRARERSFYILKTRDYTEYELYIKLKRGYFPDEIICKVLDKLKEYGYIDDERFVDNYINTYINRDSKRMISLKLQAKGIPRELIKDKLSGYDMDSSNIILDKYSKIIGEMVNCDEKTKTKLVSRLLRRGFSYEEINRAVIMYKDMS